MLRQHDPSRTPYGKVTAMYMPTNPRIVTVLFFVGLFFYGLIGLLFHRYTGVNLAANYWATALSAAALVFAAWNIRLQKLGEGRQVIKAATIIFAILALGMTVKLWSVNTYFLGPPYFLCALLVTFGYVKFMLNTSESADSRLLIPVINDDTALRRIARGE